MKEELPEWETPRLGRGTVLMRETRKAMVSLEELDPDAQTLPEGLNDNSLAKEILVWFKSMVYCRETLSQEIRNEQNLYYRSLFNLSTDKRTRLRLVDNLGALEVVVRYMEVSENDDDQSTLVAAVANLVYEDSTKLRVMAECNIPPLLTRLLRVQTNTVATHAARGIFSLTTVYEFKKRFAVQEGLLEALISCLNRDSKQLIMNAAGAIANIAIHPESKVPIVELGALQPLLHLGLYDDDEGVLHQVSRCLFSLAAEKANRGLMCERGVMQVISRLLNYSRHHDILANAIGCFGNLAMTEVEAQDHSMPTVLRILPILAGSEHSTLVRQATRVLFSFSFREVVRSAMSETKYLKVFIAKLDSRDDNVVRDVTGIISSIVSGSLPLKQEICELGGFQKLVSMFKDHYANLDLLSPITRAIYAILNCDLAKEYLCKQRPGIIYHLCQLSRERLDRPSLSRHALGALANIACDEKYLKDLFNHSVLTFAIRALFNNSRTEARKQAGRLLYNITRRHGHALSYMSRFGGAEGEDRRLAFDFKRFFSSTFSMLPVSVNLSQATGEAEDDVETLKKKGMMVLYLSCFIRRTYADDSPVLEEDEAREMQSRDAPKETYRAIVYEPLIRARCPAILTMLSSKDNGICAASQTCWQLFFEFIYTNTLSLPAADLMEDGYVYADLVELSSNFGVIKDLLEKVIALPLSATSPASLTSPPLTLTVSCTVSSVLSSSSQAGISSQSSSAAFSLQGDADQLLFGGNSVPDPLDVSLEDCSQQGGSKDEDGQPAAAPGKTGNSALVKEGAVVLRNFWESSMYSLLSEGGGDVCFTVNLDPQEQESIFPKPMTRARKASMHDAEAPVTAFSSFIQSMIDDWYLREDVKLAKGQRKRSHSTMSRDVYFRAHKAILVARSVYFRTLFDGPFRDGEENILQFRGPVDALVVMLRFLYFGVDPQLAKALMEDSNLCWRVLFVAHEYGIEGLQYYCERCIFEGLLPEAGDQHVEDMAQAANLTSAINAPFLKMICADFAYSLIKKPKVAEVARGILEDTGLSQLIRPPTSV